jgi:excinuclease ABC, C subunit
LTPVSGVSDKRRAPEVAAPGKPSASPVEPVAEAADGVSVEPALAGKPEPAVEPAPEPMIEPATDEPGQEPVREKVRTLPTKPGVYLFKNERGDVIYVGKAVSLRDRVRSYFQQQGRFTSPKVKAMVANIADVEYIVTDSEVEALILEATLIKEKAPRYNVRLKDDKAYPYLKVTDERFPRVVVVRRPGKDGRYFGPYANPRAVRETMAFLRKLFPVRTCNLDLSGELSYKPCLLYHIGRCGAPCAGLQTEEEYNKLIEEVCLFLEGRHQRLIPDLRRKMEEAAARLEFEKAARLRDQMLALERVVERQKVVSTGGEDQDVIGLARAGDMGCVQVFFIRDGKLTGRDHFFLTSLDDTGDDEALAAFIKQYYSNATFVPKEILLSHAPEEAEVLMEWLSGRRGSKVTLRVPQRGEKRRLVEMVTENAALVLAERESEQSRRLARVEQGLTELKELLGLPTLPRRIEAFDISNTQGAEPVASMVVLIDGEPATSEYRRFRIRDIQGPNDFEMMRQAVTRRFARGLQEREELQAMSPEERKSQGGKAKFAEFPDLLVIDGGKGQLGAARDALRDLGLEEIPTISLAERLEEIFQEDDPDPLLLDRSSPALHLLQLVRDEAHRFALNYHRSLRGKRQSRSALDGIEGVGPKRKKILLRHFGSVKRLREASLEEIRAVPGIPADVAERIYQEVRKAE